jgi:hypothetical protein
VCRVGPDCRCGPLAAPAADLSSGSSKGNFAIQTPQDPTHNHIGLSFSYLSPSLPSRNLLAIILTSSRSRISTHRQPHPVFYTLQLKVTPVITLWAVRASTGRNMTFWSDLVAFCGCGGTSPGDLAASKTRQALGLGVDSRVCFYS